jgi:hypothetical protein
VIRSFSFFSPPFFFNFTLIPTKSIRRAKRKAVTHKKPTSAVNKLGYSMISPGSFREAVVIDQGSTRRYPAHELGCQLLIPLSVS